ncbi:aldose epimerase family protein [Sungkyunkwania multivorans]|uniref:Aldose 1-epimerase n=1 Tax=Sungkyunkwania multivorans TaxID=1173618 RepID=A0ABW3CX46_9FLAO
MKSLTIATENIRLTALNYGAIIQKLEVKNAAEQFINVVIGHEDPERYLSDPYYLGACVGRFAGRIGNGRFSLNAKEYQLHVENGVHLHGGKEGFSKKYWEIDTVGNGREPFIRFTYHSKHLEEHYPGNLEATVTYQLTQEKELKITHFARTDRPTLVNLTNHSYFNLDGNSKEIDNHLLRMSASHYLEVDNKLIPTGRKLAVEEIHYNFTKIRAIGETRMDDTFIFGENKKEVIHLESAQSGLSMKLSTDQPAAVVYTPLDFGAICFETQNFPDAPNKTHFPSAVLHPGETYKNESIFKFEVN